MFSRTRLDPEVGGLHPLVVYQFSARAPHHDLNLDTTRFADELRQHQYAARVREDVAGRIRSGVNGTPTFYIDGMRHDAPYDLEILLAPVSAAAAIHRCART